jgi:hypothetical protein
MKKNNKRPFTELLEDKDTCRQIGEVLDAAFVGIEKHETHKVDYWLEFGRPFNYFRILLGQDGSISPFSSNSSSRQVLPTWEITQILMKAGYDPSAEEPEPPCHCGKCVKPRDTVSVRYDMRSARGIS